jgi:hypothetical protein
LDKIIAEVRSLPNLSSRIVAYASFGRLVPPDSPEFQAFLGRLAASDDKAFQQAAVQLRARLKAKTPEIPAAIGPGPGGVKFTPVPLTFGTAPGDYRTRALSGVLVVGEKTDVLWSRQAIYVMKEKGKLRLLWRGAGTDVGLYGFSSVCFDGKYVWAALPQQKTRPIIVVIDPQAEKAWEISDAEGLPAVPQYQPTHQHPTLFVAPLEPGSACFAGAFQGRAWVGLVRFDAQSGKAAVKVIHEAREAPNRTDENQWKNSTVAFRPKHIVALTGAPGAGGKAERRVVIGRSVEENIPIAKYPLVIDPDRETAEVLNDSGWESTRQHLLLVVDGVAYLVIPSMEGRQLVRFALPGPSRETLAPSLPASSFQNTGLVLHGGRLHIVNEELHKKVTGPRPEDTRVVPQFRWITVDPDGKNPHLVANELTGLLGVWVSSHYGVVTSIEQGLFNPPILHTVEIAEPAPKKK